MFHNGEREAVETTGMIDLQNGPMIRGQKLSPQLEEEFYAALELNFVPVETDPCLADTWSRQFYLVSGVKREATHWRWV